MLYCVLSCGPARIASQKSLAQMPASARQLIAIKVTGSKRFPEDAIAAATGLQMGAAVTDDEFKKAARRLGDTGVFTDIALHLLLFLRRNQGRIPRHRRSKVRPGALRGFRLVLRRRNAAAHQGACSAVRLESCRFPAAWPTRFPTYCRPCWWKTRFPGHVEYVRAGKADGPVESINYQRLRRSHPDPQDRIHRAPARPKCPRWKQRRSETSRPRILPRASCTALVQHQLLPVYYARGYLKAQFGEPAAQSREAALGRERRRRPATSDHRRCHFSPSLPASSTS